MGHPRRSKPHVQWPSPLQQVHLVRPLSQIPPELASVQDTHLWKRFSAAIYRAEGVPDVEAVGLESPSSAEAKHGDQWLAQQHREKRRCRMIGVGITLLVILVVAAAATVGVYFTKKRS